jgi:hypothetical protein
MTRKRKDELILYLIRPRSSPSFQAPERKLRIAYGYCLYWIPDLHAEMLSWKRAMFKMDRTQSSSSTAVVTTLMLYEFQASLCQQCFSAILKYM